MAWGALPKITGPFSREVDIVSAQLPGCDPGGGLYWAANICLKHRLSPPETTHALGTFHFHGVPISGSADVALDEIGLNSTSRLGPPPLTGSTISAFVIYSVLRRFPLRQSLGSFPIFFQLVC